MCKFKKSERVVIVFNGEEIAAEIIDVIDIRNALLNTCVYKLEYIHPLTGRNIVRRWSEEFLEGIM